MKRWMKRHMALWLAAAMLLSMAGTALSEALQPGDETALPEAGEIVADDAELAIEADGEWDGEAEALPPEEIGLLSALEAETDESGAEDAAAQAEANADAPEDEAVAIGSEVETVSESAALPGAEDDNDALFEAYIQRRLPGRARLRTFASPLSGRRSLEREGLEGSLKLYDLMKDKLRSVAEGTLHSTVFTFTAADLGLTGVFWTAEDLGVESLEGKIASAMLEKAGINMQSFVYAMLADYPYELYWFNKTIGVPGPTVSKGYTKDRSKVALAKITFKMTVAEDYAAVAEGEAQPYETNEMPGRVTAAVNHINEIKERCASLDDLEKVTAFADEICGLTAYNQDAVEAAAADRTYYGDPWQLVFVFDGDEATKVVCEGYAKAFKYLCDLSSFNADVACELMSGRMGGIHMWDAVRMPDGRCYVVDLTNCDGGSSCSYTRFLKGCRRNADGSFVLGGNTYSFDEKTLSVYGSDSPWLAPSEYDYGKSYGINVAETEHGTLSPDVLLADPGQTVTLTAAPELDYAAQTPVVRRGDTPVAVRSAGRNAWTFEMPYGDVSVTGDFIPDGMTVTAAGYTGVYDGVRHGITVVADKTDVTVWYSAETELTAENYDTAGSMNMPFRRDAGTTTVYYYAASAGRTPCAGSEDIEITRKDVAITGLSAADKVYDGNAAATVTGEAAIDGMAAGDDLKVAPGTAAFADRDAGIGKAVTFTGYSLTGADADNYVLTGQPEGVEASITPKAVGLTWSDTAFTYDGAAHAPAATATGLVAGDACAVTVAGAQQDAGTYTATATALSNGNYSLPAANTTAFTIAKADPAFTAPTAKAGLVYSGGDQALVNAGSVRGGELRYALEGGTYGAAIPTGKNAGTYTVHYQVVGDKNHRDAAGGTLTVTIAQREVGLAWSETAFTYDGAAHVPAASATGVAAGDACAVTVAGAQTHAGTYTATATALSNGNYRLPAATTAPFAISKRPLTVTAQAKSRFCGEADTALTYTVSGLVEGEALAGALTRKAGEKPGTYAILQGSLSASGDYALTYRGADLKILKAPQLLATLTASGKTALKLTWTKATGIGGYDVFFGKAGGKLELAATVAAGKTRAYTAKGLKRQTEYRAYVQAWVKRDGQKVYVGDASPVANAFTGGTAGKVTNPKSVAVAPAKPVVSKGGKLTLTVTVTGVKSGKKVLDHDGLVRYLSSDTAVAKVSAKGVVTGVAPGKCTVWAVASNGAYKAVKVTVGPKVTGLAFDAAAYAVKKGKTLKLGDQVTLKPADARSTLTWSTSNKKIATVDASGKVKGVKKGAVTITVTADNGKKAKVKVTVK